MEKLIKNWPLALNSAHFLLDRSQRKCSYSERFSTSIQLLKNIHNINILYSLPGVIQGAKLYLGEMIRGGYRSAIQSMKELFESEEERQIN